MANEKGSDAAGCPKNPNDDLIASQYRHIKELSKLKYDKEERREQNLIQQSSQMQTAFSFMTAAIFMAVPVCVEHRGVLSLEFFLYSVSVITAFLIASLVLATMAQWRWKTISLPDVKVIKKAIIDNPDWKDLTVDYNQMDQWVGIVGEVQEKTAKLNDRRVKLIIASMVCFYASIFSIVVSFIIGIAQIVQA